MSPSTELVEVLASTIPTTLLCDEKAVSEYLIEIAPIAGYSLSDVSRHLDAIIDRAIELKEERDNGQ